MIVIGLGLTSSNSSSIEEFNLVVLLSLGTNLALKQASNGKLDSETGHTCVHPSSPSTWIFCLASIWLPLFSYIFI